MITESKEFPGYYYIPGFGLYVLSKSGDIIQRVTKRHISYRCNTSGYYVCSLINDHGYRRQISRARLMCTTFKPTEDANFLQVDHVNCDKGDDRLENLEWVTPKENCQRAAKNGLYKGAHPVRVRDYDTKEVVIYPSIAEAARAMGMSKDAMLYRLEMNDGRVYPERKQYSFVDNIPNWADKEDEEFETQFGTAKQVYMRDIRSGVIKEFDKLSDLAHALGISQSYLSEYLAKMKQPVIDGLFQIKLKSDKSPWRDVDDPWLELAKTTGRTPVVVENVKTGITKIYKSQMECVRDRHILPSTLNERLKRGIPGTIYSDGCRYRYYLNKSQEEKGSTTSA